MLIRIRNNGGPGADALQIGTVGPNLEFVLRGLEPHYPHIAFAVVGKHLMHDVPMNALHGSPHGLRTTLVTAQNQEEILVLPEALLPHLFRRVSFFTVALLPPHATFGIG